MVDLLPGASIGSALELLDGAIIASGNITGAALAGIDLLNAYRRWANEHARLLEYVLLPGSLNDLLLTPGYGRLMQLDPRAYGDGLAFLVALELHGATVALTGARDALSRRRQEWTDWRRVGRPVMAVVVDTNILLRHLERLPSLRWWEALNVFPDEPLTLGVPLVAVAGSTA